MSIIARNDVIKAFELARLQSHTEPRRESDTESVSSSVGCDDDYQRMSPVKKVLPSLTSVVVPPLPVLPRAERVAALAQALAFLPLQEIVKARNVSSEFAEAADWVAPQPFGRSDVSFVRWEPAQVPCPVPVPNYRRHGPGAPTNFSWRCLSCNHLTCGPRACSYCGAAINVAACRVFLGQLRKELTAELTAYMLRSVAPTVEVLHIESHTNPNDGRGKGCAWAYVNSVEDAVKITALHKRIFADIDTNCNEGFWFVHDPRLVPALGVMAEALGAARNRPHTLPRQPIVAELPGKSMLADIVSGVPSSTYGAH